MCFVSVVFDLAGLSTEMFWGAQDIYSPATSPQGVQGMTPAPCPLLSDSLLLAVPFLHFFSC